MVTSPSPARTGSFGLTVLGSGSSGNSTVVHAPEGDILVDAGFSGKELQARFRLAGLDPARVKALLVTHEHSDHVKGCRIFSDLFDIPVYVTNRTHEALASGNCIGRKKALISAGSAFRLCGVDITPFSVQHDASDPLGYTFSWNGVKIGVATDLGALNMLASQRLKGCSALVLESNHDMDMLRNSSRPLHLKRRIMGRLGHLNNVDAMSALEDLLTEESRCVILAHLSSECNDLELVRTLASAQLAKMRRDDILLLIAEQAKPIQTVWLR
jgi:phosphoribosyl 1,2-cyclic phosphodiesterase